MHHFTESHPFVQTCVFASLLDVNMDQSHPKVVSVHEFIILNCTMRILF